MGPTGHLQTRHHGSSLQKCTMMTEIWSNVHTSPPFAIQLAGDHLQMVARYPSPVGIPSTDRPICKMLTLWTDPNPIVPGQYNTSTSRPMCPNNGNGYLRSRSMDAGCELSRPLGVWGPTIGSKESIGTQVHRDVTADYRNLKMVTGSTPAAARGGTTLATIADARRSRPLVHANHARPYRQPRRHRRPPPTSTTPRTPTAPTTPTTPVTSPTTSQRPQPRQPLLGHP